MSFLLPDFNTCLWISQLAVKCFVEDGYFPSGTLRNIASFLRKGITYSDIMSLHGHTLVFVTDSHPDSIDLT